MFGFKRNIYPEDFMSEPQGIVATRWVMCTINNTWQCFLLFSVHDLFIQTVSCASVTYYRRESERMYGFYSFNMLCGAKQQGFD